MFTGIIEEVGRVLSFDPQTRRLVVSSKQLVHELQTGDSIAVSGVCLTAIDITGESFSADLAAETITRTSLSRLGAGALVNLELPARAGDRMGGHIVQGHVDGTGELLRFERLPGGEDRWLEMRISEALSRFIVEKGSIAIEGISLTVASIEAGKIGVAIIPHTAQATNLLSLKPGDAVNVEVDVLAKYAEKLARNSGAQRLTIAQLVADGF
jgi:riboflavin synthase